MADESSKYLPADLYRALNLALRATNILVVKLNHVENAHPSEKEKAVRGWMQYLGIMSADMGYAVLDLLQQDRRRPAFALSRCLFEYSVKARYYLLRQDKALEHMVSLPQRIQKLATLMATDTQMKHGVDNLAAVWKSTYPDLDDKTEGALAFKDMLRAIVPANDLNDTYARRYGLPTMFLHGAAFGMLDTMKSNPRDSSYQATDTAWSVVDSLHSYLKAVTSHYGLPLEQIYGEAGQSISEQNR